MEFDKAIYKTDNESITLTFREIYSSENLEEMRECLVCPTENCNASLSYVAARHPYLKTKNTSEHIDECPHKKGENRKKARVAARNRKLVQLGEGAVMSRLNDMQDDLFPNRKKLTNRKKKYNTETKKQVIKSNQADKTTQAVASAKGELYNGADEAIRNPRVSKKRLNELIESDLGEVYKVPAILEKISKISNTKYIWKIKMVDGSKTGKVYLRDDFFKRNISNINTYLDFLKTYVESSEEKLRIAFFGKVVGVQNNEFEMFEDYGFLIYKLRRNTLKRYSLVGFNIAFNKNL